ncbi:MAG: hypothetical protein J6C04_06650, partial [Oscillospiraceae bacterium]|nr:hypothetical protein [Oscillospiraceae bacterium]
VYDNGFCTICDGYQPAVLTADKYDLDKDGEKDSVYEIGNAGQLYWFIDFVGNGNYHSYAVLTDDIVVNEGDVYGCNGTKAEGWREWTPVNYSGVFDGQGHTVSGIYCNVTSPYDVGFIGFLYCDSGYAAVQNLGVVNSYFNGRRTGGIAGKVQQKNSSNIAKVVNCYSQVYLMGGETSGAIVGQLWDGTVENCYSYGENAAGVAGYAGSYANVINCYYNKDLYKGSAIWSNNGTTDRVNYKTTQQFASGEVAYLLQGSQTERVWGQDIDNGNPAQPYPVFAGAQVNYGHRNCGDIEKTYTNSAVSDTAFSHTDITYSATGNVITATCGACTKAVGTVTVIADGKVYDGGEHGLITVEATGTMAGGTYTVTYTGENYNSTTAPSDAGEYTASVTVGGATASDSFIIYLAEPTTDMFELTYPSSLVYDGSAKTVTAAVKDGFTGVGSILVKYYDENGDLVTEAVNAGKYTVKLSVSEGENYLATQEPIYPTDGAAWEFEITKATATSTTAPAANQLTYDGTAQALVTAGTTDGGKFVYSLSENGQYSETIPTGSAAGEYTVWYYIVADENHFDSAKSFEEVVIAKADQQIEIKDIPATVTYGDAFKLSAQLGEGSMDTSWSIESGADNATIDGNGNIAVTGAGDFTVTLTSHGKQNYNNKTVSHTFTAQKKQLTVAEVIAEDKFYNGKTDATIEEITLRGILNEDSVVALGTAQFADKNAGVAKPVTITGLTLKGSAAENYTLDVTTVETTADIIPALIKVAPKAGQSKAYGTADGEFAYEITVGKLYGDDKLTGALGREEGETVGEYAYTIGTLANPDYNIAFEADDKFEIVKGTPGYTAPTGLSATYGDTLAKVKLPSGWAWKDETS